MCVEVDEWINKTRGQATFRIILETESGAVEEKEFGFFAGVHNLIEFITRIFPWASVEIDEEYYETHEQTDPEAVFHDSESPEGYFIVEGERAVGTIRPYSNSTGEVDHYRFVLSLNELGRAFAVLDRFAHDQEEYPPYDIARKIARLAKGGCPALRRTS